MISYREMKIEDVNELVEMYVESFNAPPWNDNWTVETASKRISQMINVQDFYGLCAYKDGVLCGMILGSEEQYCDCRMFNIKEFCVRNSLKGHGLGSDIFEEYQRRLKERGIEKIILFTCRDDGTEGFYHRRGLESYNDMVIMGKRLK